MKRLAFWLPPLLWMATIVWFSTAEFSAENTGTVLGPLFRWLLPAATDAQLAALWFVALTRERGLPPRRAAWVALGVAVVWAVLDELHQAMVPSRTASAMDVALDSTGAMAAAVFGRYGGSPVLEVAALFFLWAAAAGGAIVIAVDLASGVPAGVLWLTAPAAALALALRRRVALRR